MPARPPACSCRLKSDRTPAADSGRRNCRKEIPILQGIVDFVGKCQICSNSAELRKGKIEVCPKFGAVVFDLFGFFGWFQHRCRNHRCPILLFRRRIKYHRCHNRCSPNRRCWLLEKKKKEKKRRKFSILNWGIFVNNKNFENIYKTQPNKNNPKKLRIIGWFGK